MLKNAIQASKCFLKELWSIQDLFYIFELIKLLLLVLESLFFYTRGSF